jgi:hypothetical protein
MSSTEQKSIDWTKFLLICFILIAESICFNFLNINILDVLKLGGLDNIAAYSLVGCFFILSGILEFASGIASNFIPLKWSFLTSAGILTLNSFLLAIVFSVNGGISLGLTMTSIMLAATGCALVDVNTYDVLFYNDSKGAFGKLDVMLIRRFIVTICGAIAFFTLQFLTRSQGFMIIALINLAAFFVHLLMGKDLYPPDKTGLVDSRIGVNVVNVMYMTLLPSLLLFTYYHQEIFLGCIAYIMKGTLTSVLFSVLFMATIWYLCYLMVKHFHRIQAVIVMGVCIGVISLVRTNLASILTQLCITVAIGYLIYYFFLVSRNAERVLLGRGFFWICQLMINICFSSLVRSIVIWFQLYHFNGIVGPFIVNPQSLDAIGKTSAILFIIWSIIFPPSIINPRKYNLYLTYSNILSSLSLIYLGFLSLIPGSISSLLILPFIFCYTFNWFAFLRSNTRAIYHYFPISLRKPLISLTSILTTSSLAIISNSEPALYLLNTGGSNRYLYTKSFFGIGFIFMSISIVLLLGQRFLDRENWNKRNLEAN